MSQTFELPKKIVSRVFYKQTGIHVPVEQIDKIISENICMAILAFDACEIDRDKFNRVVMFNLNLILDREGKPLIYTPRKNQNIFTKFRVEFFYN
jgi:hypothetical protein